MSLANLVAGLINPKPVDVGEITAKRLVIKLTDTPPVRKDKAQPKKCEDKNLRLSNLRRIVRDRQVDWRKILIDLRRRGVNLRELSSAVGCSERWAEAFLRQRIRKMDYAIGGALLELHKEVVKGKQSRKENEYV